MTGRSTSYLELVLQKIIAIRQLAVEAEETLFVRRHLLRIVSEHSPRDRASPSYADIHLVLLKRIHLCRFLKIVVSRLCYEAAFPARSKT